MVVIGVFENCESEREIGTEMERKNVKTDSETLLICQ
jgi:hypothetical protein